jgi:hypothetical protein
MLDPRIYRTGLAAVMLAVIVFAFSLENQPAGLSTNLAPDAFNAGSAYRAMTLLAGRYPRRAPGSRGDDALAGYVAAGLRSHGFSVTTDTFPASTVDGKRVLETVVGQRAGLSNGTIVVVAHRDAEGSPARAELSGTAVLLELARILQGETLQHSVMLVSTSGSAGAAGATRLARQLAGQPVKAVLVLGDMTAKHPTQPVVVPWGSDGSVAPPALRNTLAMALRGQAGLPAGGNALAAQVARLAFPMTISEQGPFAGQAIPAVLLSASGERGPGAHEPVSLSRLAGFGRAALTTVNALDGNGGVGAPSAYLLFDGKLVPRWAVSLLVLALILPVLVTTVDGVARARRRGHRIARWVLWALTGAIPFVLAALLVRGVKVTGLLDTTPPGPVGSGVVPLRTGGVALILGALLLIVLGFLVVRPLLIRLIALAEGAHSLGPLGEGSAAGLLLVLCGVSLLIWWANPYAAALLVPALHLWLWVLDPDLRLRRSLAVLMLIVGVLPPLLVAGYYAHSLHLSPIDLIWNGILLVAGGSVGLVAAVQWSVVLGATAGVAVMVIKLDRHRPKKADVVTVRGPVSYAGPGSLGGTKSALRH